MGKTLPSAEKFKNTNVQKMYIQLFWGGGGGGGGGVVGSKHTIIQIHVGIFFLCVSLCSTI